MHPAQLKPEHFAGYPPRAREVAVSGIEILRRLPLAFVPSLLREVIEYDWKFPAERQEVDSQFVYLGSLSQEQLQHLLAPFETIKLSGELVRFNWIKTPGAFTEQLSNHLWATHQVARFREAASAFISAFRAAVPEGPPATPRLGIVMIGQGVARNSYPLFRKLRAHGAYFTDVDPANGRQAILDAVAARCNANPSPFAHWYIDGGFPDEVRPNGLTCMSYDSLASVRDVLVKKMRTLRLAGNGTEAIRTAFAQMSPEEVGLSSAPDDGVLNHFQLSIMAEGSGTQLFSTSFVQWTAREVFRRARPLTLLARFAPRQTERSMDEMLAGTRKAPVLDPEGSLVDADMGAYYTWLNQQRLSGAAQSSFMVWFENQREALIISPSSSRETESNSRVAVGELLEMALGLQARG